MENKLNKKFFEAMVLMGLKEAGEIHGYGFIDMIRERYGFSPSPGIVYPVLRSLVRRGLVEAVPKSQGARRLTFYRITENGLRFLKENSELVKNALEHDKRLILARKVGLIEFGMVLKNIFLSLDKLDDHDLEELNKIVHEFIFKLKRYER